MEERPLVLFTLLLQAAAWVLAGMTRWLAAPADPEGLGRARFCAGRLAHGVYRHPG